MSDEFNPWIDALLSTTKQLEQMRAERDQARREVCGWASRHFNEHAEHVARERGWDCFKEDGA